MHKKVRNLIPVSAYIDSMRKQKELAAGVKRVRFFLATDDAEAEAEIKAAFPAGELSFPRNILGIGQNGGGERGVEEAWKHQSKIDPELIMDAQQSRVG